MRAVPVAACFLVATLFVGNVYGQKPQDYPTPPNCRHKGNVPQRGVKVHSDTVSFTDSKGRTGSASVKYEVVGKIDMCEAGKSVGIWDQRECAFKGKVVLLRTANARRSDGSTFSRTSETQLSGYFEVYKGGTNCNQAVADKTWHGAHDRAVSSVSWRSAVDRDRDNLERELSQ